MIDNVAAGLSSWFLKRPREKSFVLLWPRKELHWLPAQCVKAVITTEINGRVFRDISLKLSWNFENEITLSLKREIDLQRECFYIIAFGSLRGSPRTTSTNHVPFAFL